MESITDYKIPLEELLDTLKAGGYEVSVERILDIQSVLLSSPVSQSGLANLKYTITPILAKNDTEQTSIYKIIDAYISDKKKDITQKPRRPRAVFLENRRLVLLLKVTGVVLMALLAAGLYFIERNTTPNIPANVKTHKATTENNKPSAPLNQPPAPKQANNSTAQTPSLEYSLEFKKPIVPEAINLNLQMSGIFGITLGIILAYLLFYESRKKMELKKKERNTFSDHTGREKEAGSPWPGKKEQEYEQVILQFPDKDYVVQRTAAFGHIKANLQKQDVIETSRLDIKKSIASTTKNAGFRSFVFDSRLQEKKYLIIADNKNPDAQITHLLNYLVDFIITSRIAVTKYTYDADIREVKDNTGKTWQLEALAHDKPDHHLIIIGDCHSFFDTDRLLPGDPVDIFHKWSSRSIITPVALPDWSDMEMQLENKHFRIVPADIGAIELLTKTIASHSSFSRKQLEKKIGDLYFVPAHDLQSAVTVKEYLDNEELFKVVCSLAVYPKLKWSLTLALFSAIVKNKPLALYGAKPDYDTLLKICRLPFLNRETMDESIRMQLLSSLDRETEIIARETMLKLLREVEPLTPPDSLAFKEFQSQYQLNAFFLFAHDQYKYKEYAGTKKEIIHHWNKLEDPVIKERINRREAGLMPAGKSGQPVTIEEFILQEQEFEKLDVTFTKIALLTVPAILLYILFFLFKPDLVYPPGLYKKVSFRAVIKRDEECLQKLTHALIFKDGKFDTIPLRRFSNIDSFSIKDVPYDGTIGLHLLSKDSTNTRILLAVRDSVVVVTAACK